MPNPNLKVQIAGSDKPLPVEVQNKKPLSVAVGSLPAEVGVSISNAKTKKGTPIPVIVAAPDQGALPVATRPGEVLSVSLGANPLPVTLGPAPLPVALTNPAPDASGLPPDLRSGIIALRVAKKEIDYFQVESSHGEWALLTPVTPEDGPNKSKAGWYHLASLSAGPWNSAVLPVVSVIADPPENESVPDPKPAKKKAKKAATAKP